MVGNSPNLTLLMTSDDLAGRYYCKASVMGFPEVGAEATVYLKGRPTIISHRTQFGIPGDTARVECSAFSIPPPEKVTWSYRGEEIGVGSSDDYSVSYTLGLYFTYFPCSRDSPNTYLTTR